MGEGVVTRREKFEALAREKGDVKCRKRLGSGYKQMAKSVQCEIEMDDEMW